MPQILEWSLGQILKAAPSVRLLQFGLVCRRRRHLASFLDAARSSAQRQSALWGLAKERGDRHHGICEHIQSG